MYLVFFIFKWLFYLDFSVMRVTVCTSGPPDTLVSGACTRKRGPPAQGPAVVSVTAPTQSAPCGGHACTRSQIQGEKKGLLAFSLAL